MKSISVNTLEPDAYRAGVELADALAPIAPDVVFLFSSIDFQGSAELPQAIFDVLGNEKMLLIGCTGEGFLETSRVADIGACALGLHFDGHTRAALASARRIGADTATAMKQNLTKLTEQLGQEPDICFVFCDFHNDGSAVEKVLQSRGIIAVGGFAGDDMLEMKKCFLYANRDVLEDGIVTLGLCGDFKWDIHLAHNLEAVGRIGTVTEAEGTRLGRIDQQSAVAFTEAAIRRPISMVDQGAVTLNVLDKDNPEKKYLRSIVTNSVDSFGGYSLFGGIHCGSKVQVCIAQPGAIVKEVYDVAEVSKACGYKPVAGLIVSCAGRKHLLGNRIEHEVLAVRDAFDGSIALVGFPSFGEISPVRMTEGYSETFFHNMTYVLLLMGE